MPASCVALGDQPSGAIPDEARLVDPLSVDELRPLQDPHGAGRRQGTDVDGQLQRRHPAGELDVEGGRREGVHGEQQGGRIEGLARREAPANLAALPGRWAGRS